MGKDKSIMEGSGSLSGMVASKIEKDILSGRLASGSFLKSSREMAAIYEVSKTVIGDAIEILAQKNLILRLPRKGFIVKGKAQQEGMIDVLLFAMDREPGKSAFVREMLRLPQTPGTDARINFTIRLACSQSEHSNARLEEELLRLEKFGYPDCVIIIPIGFTRREMEMCLKLPYPVIFLGEFDDRGSYPDLKYRQVYPESDSSAFVAGYAAEKRYRSMVKVIPEFACDAQYVKESNRNLRTAAERAGLAYSELLIPGRNQKEAHLLMPYILEREKARLQAADLLYSSWMAFPKMNFPHPELLNHFANPGTGVPWLRIDYTLLFEQLVKEIRNCRKTLTKSIIRKVPVRCIGIDSVPPGIEII
ncbi:MAG: winged helix-turn-helix transcriptional regulator [Lentisphaerae bacterium]|nr:winged helix-turn-helix transcriptional regulator [Lentisphaerota bacterium]